MFIRKIQKAFRYIPFIKLSIMRIACSKFLCNTTIRTFGFKVRIQDFISFFYEMIYIFKDEIYKFTTDKKNPFIIDGGVCIGTSLLYFKKIYPQSIILGFEPDELAFNIAKENIKQNNLSSIQMVRAALYNTDTEISFETKSIDSNKISTAGDKKIPAHKLSNYITEQVDFLKLNIEGAEYNVLEDLHSTGKIKMVKEMCFEWHSFAHQAQNLDRVLKILTDNNFKYYISGLSTAPRGNFIAEKETEYFLMVYAKQIN